MDGIQDQGWSPAEQLAVASGKVFDVMEERRRRKREEKKKEEEADEEEEKEEVTRHC